MAWVSTLPCSSIQSTLTPNNHLETLLTITFGQDFQFSLCSGDWNHQDRGLIGRTGPVFPGDGSRKPTESHPLCLFGRRGCNQEIYMKLYFCHYWEMEHSNIHVLLRNYYWCTVIYIYIYIYIYIHIYLYRGVTIYLYLYIIYIYLYIYYRLSLVTVYMIIFCTVFLDALSTPQWGGLNSKLPAAKPSEETWCKFSKLQDSCKSAGIFKDM